MGFEGRLGEGRGSELARCCWKEMREREQEKGGRDQVGRGRRGNGLRIGDGGLRRWKKGEKKRVDSLGR